MVAHQFNPLEDARWGAFLQRHPRSSLFHSAPWLEALRRTYQYEPLVLSTSPPDAELENALVLCRVGSWITGRRLVSLPFSDHCEPLLDSQDLQVILSTLGDGLMKEGLRYIELRPQHPLEMASSLHHSTYTYCSHELDLRPDLDTLFRTFHKDSTQRKIRRAEREGLTYEEGRSASLLNDFYRLLILTRRRHGVPPQPKQWFQNLIDCFRESLKIRVAFKGARAVAAILTLTHKDTLFYKYGCSDTRFNNLGGMQLLFWKSIQESKDAGLRVFDLGRSDLENSGLITFKDRWGAARSTLTYARLSSSPRLGYRSGGPGWAEGAAKRALALLPDRVLSTIGDLVYRHIG